MPDLHNVESRSNGCDEATRSSVLHSYGILDTPREEDFDDLAQIASAICGTPIAVVNLVDTDRQFFKAEVGLGVRETPLESSFCRKAILSEDTLVVPDTTRDPRFEDNPLVVGEPKLRFYAGAVLKSPEGLPIGTVCVLDYVPRELSPLQVRTLRSLARQAMAQLELRRSMAAQKKALEAAEAAKRETAILASIVEQSSDFIAMADTTGRAFFLNDAARNMVGLADADISTTNVVDYFHEDDKPTVLNEVMPTVTKEGYWEGELRFRNFKTREVIPVLYNIFPLRDGVENLIGYGTVTKDITLQKQELQRRTDVAVEMAHRMKNVLAMVQAIATQTFRTAASLEEGREAISGRLTALARAQDILTSADTSRARIADIVETALAPHRTGQGRCSLSGPPLDINGPQALGLSLAVHELATNAAKYGALSDATGGVGITWKVLGDGRFRFEWTETGGPRVAAPTQTGFGSKLLERTVASYFDGQAELVFDPAGLRFWLEGEIRVMDKSQNKAAE